MRMCVTIEDASPFPVGGDVRLTAVPRISTGRIPDCWPPSGISQQCRSQPPACWEEGIFGVVAEVARVRRKEREREKIRPFLPSTCR